MSIFIRKHRKSIFSFLLPLLFLGLTVALIQCGSNDGNLPDDTLNGTVSGLGGECLKDTDCVASITLGELVCNTVTNKCQTTNVGCDPVNGQQVEVDQTANSCICVDTSTGQQVGPCVVCPPNEIVVGGACCDPNRANNLPGGCPQLEGSGL